MIQRATLHVLAEAAEIGLPEAAHVPARAFDPFFRPSIKKKVRQAIDAADARTTSKAGDHVLRIAFLVAHPGAPKELDWNDVRAVEAAFRALAGPYLPPRHPEPTTPKGGAYRAAASDRDESPFATPPKRPRRFWPITVPLLLTFLVGGLVFVGVLVAPFIIPTPFARFRGTPFGKALEGPLTDVVTHAARDSDNERWPGGRREAARLQLEAPDVKKQIGREAHEALGRALDELPLASLSDEASIDAALAPVFAEVNALDTKLYEKKVPALLHVYGSGSPGKRAVWITSYFVESRFELTLDGKAALVAWGRRMDSLNLAENTLYKANAENWAILSLEAIEEEFVQTLLSPIARGTPFSPDDFTPNDRSVRAELVRTAGRVVTAEMMAKARIDASDADGLYRAIARRNEAAVDLAKNGYSVKPSSRIELAPHTVRGLTRAKVDNPRDAPLIDELLRINDRIGLERKRVAPAMSELAQVEEEEFVALILEKEKIERDVPTPKLVAARASKHVRAIVSSQLGLVARPQACTHLALWRLARLLVQPNVGREDARAGGIALASMLHHLDLLPASTEEPEIDDAFAKALTRAFELPSERLRAAAAKAYEELLARPVSPLTRKALR